MRYREILYIIVAYTYTGHLLMLFGLFRPTPGRDGS